MAKKKVEEGGSDELPVLESAPVGFEPEPDPMPFHTPEPLTPAEEPTVPEIAKASPPAKTAAASAGMVRCKVHTGTYVDDKTYPTGSVVDVPAAEVEKLAHCLAPL